MGRAETHGTGGSIGLVSGPRIASRSASRDQRLSPPTQGVEFFVRQFGPIRWILPYAPSGPIHLENQGRPFLILVNGPSLGAPLELSNHLRDGATVQSDVGPRLEFHAPESTTPRCSETGLPRPTERVEFFIRELAPVGRILSDAQRYFGVLKDQCRTVRWRSQILPHTPSLSRDRKATLGRMCSWFTVIAPPSARHEGRFRSQVPRLDSACATGDSCLERTCGLSIASRAGVGSAEEEVDGRIKNSSKTFRVVFDR